MRPLNVAVPPRFCELVLPDYRGRYLGLHWLMSADELQVTIPHGAHAGSRRAYQAFVHHPRNFAALQGCKLGSTDSTAREMLILDRQDLRAHVVSLAQGRAFLNRQAPQSELLTLQPRSTLTSELIRIDREARAIDQMLRWLDGQISDLSAQEQSQAQVALLLRRLQGGAV